MLTCNINIQSTLPVNTKEQLVTYTKAQLLEMLISYPVVTTHSLSQVGTLTFDRLSIRMACSYIPSIQSTPNITRVLHYIFQRGACTLVSTQPLLRTSGQPLGNLCREGGDKTVQMLQDHHMRLHLFPLQYSCVLCQKWFEEDKTYGGSS